MDRRCIAIPKSRAKTHTVLLTRCLSTINQGTSDLLPSQFTQSPSLLPSPYYPSTLVHIHDWLHASSYLPYLGTNPKVPPGLPLISILDYVLISPQSDLIPRHHLVPNFQVLLCLFSPSLSPSLPGRLSNKHSPLFPFSLQNNPRPWRRTCQSRIHR